MAATAVVRARIDEKTKRQASQALANMGLSVSDAIRMLLIRIAADEAMPFEVKVPNAETVAAMEEALRGGLRSFKSVEELFSDGDEEN